MVLTLTQSRKALGIGDSVSVDTGQKLGRLVYSGQILAIPPSVRPLWESHLSLSHSRANSHNIASACRFRLSTLTQSSLLTVIGQSVDGSGPS